MDANDAQVADAANDAANDANDGSADAGPTTFTTSRTAIDFGLVGCARQGQPITFSLNNTGGVAFTWSSLLVGGGSSLFTLTPPSGTLAPGAAETITVSMATVPYPGSTSVDYYADKITLKAVGTGGTKTLDVPVKLRPREPSSASRRRR